MMLAAVSNLALLTARQPATPAGPSAIVAADGSAQYRTVQEAINAAPQDTSPDRRWVIFVKAGTYHELLYVQREKHFVMLVGEDPLETVITYGLKAGDTGPDGKAIGTFRTPTAVIDADDFSAENLTFENSAGPHGQALAIRVDGDRVVFRNCRFLGRQDTIFIDRGRQYFEDSVITGDVDFIFGGATAFFERCRLHAAGNGYLTAASTPQEASHGFVFARGSITGEPGVKTYLGRPWRAYAAVAFVQTGMSDAVRPEGWHNWDHPEREQTTRYAEFGTTGAGASANRVKWAHALSAADAAKLTVEAVLGGVDTWDPRRVPAHPSAVRALDGPVHAPASHLRPPI